MKSLPKICPSCGKTKWQTTDHPYFFQKAVKKEDTYDVKTNKGMIGRIYVCSGCNYLMFFKEAYDKDFV